MSGMEIVENNHPSSWMDLSLQAGGRSLIEASAGTGKTWTIAVLYLRLLLERGLSPKQIVVTTFTDAAAQELRERIRSRVLAAEQTAKQVLEGSGAKGDEDWLASRWRDDSDAACDVEKVSSDLNRLRLAAAELDLAPIGTLHSLCRKILTDYPFESGSTFDLGDMVSSDSMLGTLSDDVWRQLQQSNGRALDLDIDCGSRSSLRKHLKAYSAPGVTLPTLGEVAPLELDHCLADQIRNLLGLGVFTRKRTFKNALGDLAAFLESTPHNLSLLKVVENLTPEDVEAHINATGLNDPAVIAVVESAMEIGRALQVQVLQKMTASWQHWVTQLKTWRQQRLAAAGQITFDELIERVYRALPKGGSVLADRLFDAWPVALVDEFQDTDAQQYAILDRIYRDREGAHRGRLVMIGDPKQAIYRFRGGDIDAYLTAKQGATSTLTLDTNFRSSRELVDAFNAFYARAGEVLSSNAHHEICYEAVKPSTRCDDKPYLLDGKPCERPLQFHHWEGDGVPDDAPSRTKLALEACANHIVQLLSANDTIGGKPVKPGDIAVLLPSNTQITTLRDLLASRNVPCVSSAKSSVFGSDWARELQIVLYAAMHSRDEGAVRAALATRLGGVTYDQLRELRDQPEQWQRKAAVFAQLDDLWQTRGVLALVQKLITDARSRLFSRVDSERTLTDLRHLGELLQARSEKLTGREQLLAWLADQRDDEGDEAGDAADEMQLRIESDAARVRLMTLHSSKGLEFPIVMLPMMWANKHNTKDTITVLHDQPSGQRVVGFGAEEKQRYQQEGQDERFRLLYVALTRARYACHIYALSPGRLNKKDSKTPDADPNRAPLDTMLERLFKIDDFQGAMENVLWSEDSWRWPEAKYLPQCEDAVSERHVWSEPDATRFEFKYSFSALLKGGKIALVEERAASDESQTEDERANSDDSFIVMGTPSVIESTEDSGAEAEHQQLQWLASIAGADFGNAVHAIFEHRAIGRPMSEQHALVRHHLLDEGVYLGDIAMDDLVPHLADRIQATLDTPLLPAIDPTLTLGALPEHALRAEMEFNFVLNEVSLRRLREVCNFVPGASMDTLRGLMNGKIDLVFEHAGRFHVLDYKGNRLDDGGDPRNYAYLSNYSPERLEFAMKHAHYRFQALLYTVAVDRYLRERVPQYDRSKHLGESIYLFVRATGIAPDIAPTAGIWAHRFDDDLIDAVDAVFASEAREAA